MKINEMTRPWESFLDPVTQSNSIAYAKFYAWPQRSSPLTSNSQNFQRAGYELVSRSLTHVSNVGLPTDIALDSPYAVDP